VAPTGSATSNRQAEMMYLLWRHILGRNFFLRPDCVHRVPEAVRRHHSKRRCHTTWIGAALGLEGALTSGRGGGSPRPERFVS